MNNKINILEENVRERYASVVWSHKIHEQQAEIDLCIYNILEITKIIISAATSVGIFSLIFRDQLYIKIVTTIFSFILTAIVAYEKSFDNLNKSKKHKQTAHELLEIRDELKDLLMLIKFEDRNLNEYTYIFKELTGRLNNIYDNELMTSKLALKRAEKRLKYYKDNTFSDDEIDCFLPECLRKDGSSNVDRK